MSEKGLYVEINQQTLMDKGVGPWAEGLYLFLSSHSRPLKKPTKNFEVRKGTPRFRIPMSNKFSQKYVCFERGQRFCELLNMKVVFDLAHAIKIAGCRCCYYDQFYRTLDTVGTRMCIENHPNIFTTGFIGHTKLKNDHSPPATCSPKCEFML